MSSSGLAAEWRVVPMAWWNRMTRLSWSRRAALTTIERLQTWGNLRPIYEVLKRIREWRIDLVRTHSGLISWGAVVAKRSGIPHVRHCQTQCAVFWRTCLS
jgi:UDP-N-acetylglucosamine:LPS N-acetylglucosamine transferase